MKVNLPVLSKRAAGTAELFFRKNGPMILTAAGIAGFVATNILTGKAVFRSQDKALKLRADVGSIAEKPLTEEYTARDRNQDLLKVWVSEGGAILRDFTPAIITGVVSVSCLIASHGMLKQQNASLIAAYTALDKGFRAYRKRVEEELGADKEREIYGRVRTIPGEPGEDGITPCEVDMESTLPSPYSRFFDESNCNWVKTPEYNMMFLRQQQQWLNDRLNSYGFVFLNEAYEALGMERSQAGQIVGWKSKYNGGQDGYIDFGLYDITDETGRAFVNGMEATVLVDFNVDGPISIGS
jgi:Family of unknown function (DUF6353)